MIDLDAVGAGAMQVWVHRHQHAGVRPVQQLELANGLPFQCEPVRLRSGYAPRNVHVWWKLLCGLHRGHAIQHRARELGGSLWDGRVGAALERVDLREDVRGWVPTGGVLGAVVQLRGVLQRDRSGL